MDLMRIYDWGLRSPLRFSVPSVDKKLKFVEFKYTSEAVIGASVTMAAASTTLTIISVALGLSQFFPYFFFFVGNVIALAMYMYPVNIYYTQSIIEYREEMLKAVMHITTYISLNTSIEYAIIETRQHLHGTLRTQVDDIIRMLHNREKNTLGEVIALYTPIWNEVNPDFVKALRLIETAAMSKKDEKVEILQQVQKTLLLAYETAGKRSAEDLSNNAKSLVAIGVLFPIITLMLLPLVSVFMPGIVKPALLAFIYIVLFPAVLLIMALNFSAKRIQVDTIRLKDSPQYVPFSVWDWSIGVLIVVIFAIPTILHLVYMDTSTVAAVSHEYAFSSIIYCWLLSFGIFLAVIILTYIYTRKYEKLWNAVNETEQDLPYLLQNFSTYLSLNVSVENILMQIVGDYKSAGFGDRSAVRYLTQIIHELKTSKQTLVKLAKDVLPKIVPSRKVSSLISEVISFTQISTRGAAQAAKIVHEQVVAINQLDDYMQTLLSDTVGLINITTAMLAPLLCAAAILMSVAIVKSLTYIQNVLSGIGGAFNAGADQGVQAGLVNITTIIPPTIIEIIISIYLLELIIVLSVFAANIKVGNDSFQLAKTVSASMIGYILFSLILLLGYFVMNNWIFAQFFPASGG